MKKYKLIWKAESSTASECREDFIGFFNTWDDAYNNILDWWESHDFVPPYVIFSDIEDGCTMIDYGCHHFFYYISYVD